MNPKISWFLSGLFFSFLWASAAAATKIGLQVAQPLVIAVTRFGMASSIMLFFSHILCRSRLPAGREWRQLCIYGLLNISVYLGLYVVAMRAVSAGIGTLAVAANPVFIGFLSVFFLKKKFSFLLLLSMLICAGGVLLAAWPLFEGARVTGAGLLILFAGMLSYSCGSIYFSAVPWNGLSLLVINGWQTLLGGLLLLPLTLFFYKGAANQWNGSFWLSVAWLAIPVSILAVQLWLRLLQINPVRAGLWLFLCPLFGFMIAAALLHDPISLYTAAGMSLVLAGLFLARSDAKKDQQ
jgi:drug/metabolite transporter (DMT)-like permease